MAVRTKQNLAKLYLADETAWLEQMARLIGKRRYDELDYSSLKGYVEDMAIRDRREVKSRLTVLTVHVLKWTYQPKKRSRSWSGTILAQQDELTDILTSKLLRKHAIEILGDAY